jgi:hypothetical protein
MDGSGRVNGVRDGRDRERTGGPSMQRNINRLNGNGRTDGRMDGSGRVNGNWTGNGVSPYKSRITFSFSESEISLSLSLVHRTTFAAFLFLLVIFMKPNRLERWPAIFSFSHRICLFYDMCCCCVLIIHYMTCLYLLFSSLGPRALPN